MAAHRTSFETKAKDLEQICSDCSRNSQAASKSYRLNTLDLSSFESESLRTELMSIMSSVPDDLFTFSYDGFSFGNLCAFEVCIGMKCSRLDAANAEIRSAWLLLIESALKAYLLVLTTAPLIPSDRLGLPRNPVSRVSSRQDRADRSRTKRGL